MRLIILALFASTSIYSKAITKTGDKVNISQSFTLEELVRDYASLKGMNLGLSENLAKERLEAYGPRKLKVEQLKAFVDFALFEAGFNALYDPHTNTLSVMASRDVRYAALDAYTQIDEVPRTFQYAKYVYKMKNISGNDLARNLRPFLSRYGRVIDGPEGKSLVLSETGKNIHRVHQLLELIDSEEFQKERLKAQKINEKAIVELPKEGRPLSENIYLFVLLFSLISGTIGFIARGYSIKRIEGGW